MQTQIPHSASLRAGSSGMTTRKATQLQSMANYKSKGNCKSKGICKSKGKDKSRCGVSPLPCAKRLRATTVEMTLRTFSEGGPGRLR